MQSAGRSTACALNAAPARAHPAKRSLWDQFKHLFTGDSQTLINVVVDHCATITLDRIRRGELSLLPNRI